MLELKFIELGYSLRAREIGWLTFFFKPDLFAESVFQSALDQINREISDVDTDPLSIQLLGRVNSRAASAKRIEHHIAGIARCADDALKQRLRFLCWIAETFLRLRINRENICPDSPH